MTAASNTQTEAETTLAEKLAYILDNAPPDSQWRQTVEYNVSTTYELIREERGDF